MQQKRELINLTVINNSSSVIAIPLFQRNVASINATTKYSYDITGIDLSCGVATIYINSVLYSITFDTTQQGLVSSLSALGFGLFGIESSTFVYTTDDTNVYGNMDLCGGGATTTTTTTTTTAAPATSTTTTTTTLAPETSTTTTTTTLAPATSTTTTTTTLAPETSTTTTTTTLAPETSTTTTTTTLAPETSTTTTTTTLAPETSTTTTTTTEAPTTSTTTTTTTLASNIFLDMSLSVDTTISQITVNGAPVTYISGATLPNTGGSNSNLNTTEYGSSQNLVITYSCTFSGHKITLTDSVGTVTCQNTGVGTNITMSFPTTNISSLSQMTILVEDGTCV